MILAVAFGPLLWRVQINDIDFAAQLQAPSWAHPLGTDDLGQDLLARMLYGGRISLAVGLAAMSVSVVVGTTVGALAGISRGSVDAALMWLTDLFLSLPQLPVLLLIIYLFRDSLTALVGPGARDLHPDRRGDRRVPLDAGGATGARAVLRVAREGVRRGGARARRLDVPPGGAPHPAERAGPVIVAGTIDVAAAIIAESTLSFLGLGFPPDIPTWGRILFDAKDYLDIAPHWALFAGGAIFLAVLAINFIGDGLRDALDPRRVM